MPAEEQKECDYDLTMRCGVFTTLTPWRPPHGNAHGFTDGRGTVYRPILLWERTERYGEGDVETYRDLTDEEAAEAGLSWEYDKTTIEPTER